jgi:hypothetical protein
MRRNKGNKRKKENKRNNRKERNGMKEIRDIRGMIGIDGGYYNVRHYGSCSCLDTVQNSSQENKINKKKE